ncbi:autotransporter outer membrane beta-barrel domain-containing protein [Pseudomonas coleopterorum]|uniref:autotransporter family protein n=1 Tax=Pseudomonas coleopterorum TaxID=1605838 RepID=UPI002A6A1663|nr:autotransporter outer membrane beta-barrel domain-containing protein [Pseudomonas coleopterorum]MDY1015703.1 autotransporter outer membrane beta-barrel domain-containing protein [Pseudomonas coleopterorum]
MNTNKLFRHRCLLTASLLTSWAASNMALADCTFAPGLGNDAYVCDSGTAPSLSDLLGNNSLTLPPGGTGTITGAVEFGPGQDSVLLGSGSIGGVLNTGAGADTVIVSGGRLLSLIQGDGADTLEVIGGTISGPVSQGSGIDSFIMRGGQIQSLSQGDGLDTFSMTDGTIVGAFEDGDIARMSGGTIGRVDMKLDNNLFELSGGRINGNLVAGFGNDTIAVSGGSIGGNISVSGGVDEVTVSGGDIGGNVLLSFGDDRFIWRDAGLIHGTISMGAGDDTALLSNLEETQLASPRLIYGDAGIDTLTLDNSRTTGGARYSYWETINLSNGSVLDLPDRLSLADDSTPPNSGLLTLDRSSTLGATQGTVGPIVEGQTITLNNAGLIDLTRSGTQAGDRLTVIGNYVGNDARLKLQTVLAGDDAPSDRLVVAQGTLSGLTAITVDNLDGRGAQTTANGITLVEATQGATSTNGAFTLANNLSVGAYQYYLFKGGVTAGSENSWFLRSSVVAPPVVVPPVTEPPEVVPPVVEPPVVQPPTVEPPVIEPPVVELPVAEPEPPVIEPPAVEPPVIEPPVQPQPPEPEPTPPAPAPGAQEPIAAIGTPNLPHPAPGQSIVLYRIEVPAYSVVPPAAALLALDSLGSFHERQGEQGLLRERGALPAGWARTFGSRGRQQWAGAAAPSLSANISGYQVGHDLFAALSDNGYRQHVGLFAGHARLDGNVRGFALGFDDTPSGHIRLRADNLGAYWTVISPAGAYLDLVAMSTRFEGRSRSERGYTLDLDGHGVAVSLEAGYPLRLSEQWLLEPQVQVVGQKITLDTARDLVSKVAFDSEHYWRTRLGVRLKGQYRVGGTPVEPYVQANLWHTLDGEDAVTFDEVDTLRSQHRATQVKLGIGLAARLSDDVSLYLNTDYARSLDSQPQESLQGSLGLRISW